MREEESDLERRLALMEVELEVIWRKLGHNRRPTRSEVYAELRK